MADTRRRGGRAARKALHAAPTPDEERAVQPGMSSGRYQPLSETDVELIHGAVLDVLEKIGLANAFVQLSEEKRSRLISKVADLAGREVEKHKS